MLIRSRVPRSTAWRAEFDDNDPEPIISHYDPEDPDFPLPLPYPRSRPDAPVDPAFALPTPLYLLPGFNSYDHLLKDVLEGPERSALTVQSTPAPPTEQVMTPVTETIIVSPSIAQPIVINTFDEPDEEPDDLLSVPVPVPQKPEVVPEPDSPPSLLVTLPTPLSHLKSVSSRTTIVTNAHWPSSEWC